MQVIAAVAAAGHHGQESQHTPAAAGTKLDALRRERRDGRRDRYAAIRRLHDEGVPPRLIAPMVGVSQRSVERWLAASGEPEHRRPPVATLIDPFRPYLERRWQEDCRSAAELWRGIAAQGFTGSLNTVARWAAPRRRSHVPSPAATAARTASRRAPSRRRCAWLLSVEPEQADLHAFCAAAGFTAEGRMQARPLLKRGSAEA